jgi:hypothetical protein
MQITEHVKGWQVTFLDNNHIHVTNNKTKHYNLTYKVVDRNVSLLPTNDRFFYDCPKYVFKYIEEKVAEKE